MPRFIEIGEPISVDVCGGAVGPCGGPWVKVVTILPSVGHAVSVAVPMIQLGEELAFPRIGEAITVGVRLRSVWQAGVGTQLEHLQ